MNKFIKTPVILSIMTFVCAGLLMISESLTYERIAEQKKQLLLASLEQLIPPQMHDNDLTTNALSLFDQDLLGHRSAQTAYIGMLNNKLSVVAIPATARNGYTGDIDIIVGVTAAGNITSVKILSHQETPGLGDLIEADKSDWIQQFPDQSFSSVAQNNWQVKKDGGQFDQITGATISPRAVTEAIKKVLLFHRSHFDANGYIDTNNTINKPLS